MVDFVRCLCNGKTTAKRQTLIKRYSYPRHIIVVILGYVNRVQTYNVRILFLDKLYPFFLPLLKEFVLSTPGLDGDYRKYVGSDNHK